MHLWPEYLHLYATPEHPSVVKQLDNYKDLNKCFNILKLFHFFFGFSACQSLMLITRWMTQSRARTCSGVHLPAGGLHSVCLVLWWSVTAEQDCDWQNVPPADGLKLQHISYGILWGRHSLSTDPSLGQLDAPSLVGCWIRKDSLALSSVSWRGRHLDRAVWDGKYNAWDLIGQNLPLKFSSKCTWEVAIKIFWGVVTSVSLCSSTF